MRICLAQTESKKGNINWNISNHKKWIEVAISKNADLIAFPELSLTGYEPNLANKLATNRNDLRLNDFQELSDKNQISIGIGLPTKTENGILIGQLDNKNESMLLFDTKTKEIHQSGIKSFKWSNNGRYT